MRTKLPVVAIPLALTALWDYLLAMELLDQLEQRIGALLDRVDRLSRENASLKEEQARDLAALAEENDSLKRQLDEERAKNANALGRIEGILDRIRSEAGAEPADQAGEPTVQE